MNAADRAREPRTATATVNVLIIDSNDCTPTFVLAGGHNTFGESDGAQVGYRVGCMQATDCDVGPNAALEYVLRCSAAAAQTARRQHCAQTHVFGQRVRAQQVRQLTLKRPLDREDVEEYHFAVLAVEQGAPRLIGTAEELVQVRNENNRVTRRV